MALDPAGTKGKVKSKIEINKTDRQKPFFFFLIFLITSLTGRAKYMCSILKEIRDEQGFSVLQLFEGE
jgi:hypothetical protein